MRIGGAVRSGVGALAIVAALLPPAAAHAATRTPYSPGESVAVQLNAAHDGHLASGAPALPLQKKWSRNLGLRVSYPIVAAGKVFVTTKSGDLAYGTYLHAVDAATGATAWGPVPLGGTYYWSGLAYGGGRLFALNYDGVLRAFDPASGAQLWIRQLPDQYAFSSEPTYADGIVYVGGAGIGGTLYAVSAVTGKVLWTRPVVNGDHSSPAVSEGRVFVSYSCPNTFGFEAVDGAPLWTYSTGCSGGGGRTPVVAEGLVWVRDGSGGPIALDARTGQLANVHNSVRTPAFDGDRGYFLEGRSLVAREPRTQLPLWTFDGDGQLSSPPIVVGEHVYVGSASGMLYAVDAVTGLSPWSTNVGAPILAPDEHNVSEPVTGLGAGGGLIVVPAANLLVAYGSATPQPPPPPQVSLAWGWNALGQLGTSGTTDRHAAATVTGGTNYRSVSGGAYHSLAVRPDGSAWGWGWNGVGQLGNGTLADAHQPSRVLGLSGVTAVSAGFYHSLALRSDGTVWAWGWNVLGQLGDGTTTDRHQPVRVPFLDNVVAISAGALHSVALRADGTVWSWGWNGVGQLGDGTLVDRRLPVKVSGLAGVTALDAGAHHNLARRGDGSVAAWGWNAVGQLGNGTHTDSRVPVTVTRSPGFEAATAVSAGMYHSAAVSERATVWAWGWNGLGALGDGTTTDRASPVRVAGLTGVVTVDAGGLHTVAVDDDGATFASGWNGYGQVGDGTTVDRHEPVRVPGTHNATVAAAGIVHTLVA